MHKSSLPLVKSVSNTLVKRLSNAYSDSGTVESVGTGAQALNEYSRTECWFFEKQNRPCDALARCDSWYTLPSGVKRRKCTAEGTCDEGAEQATYLDIANAVVGNYALVKGPILQAGSYRRRRAHLALADSSPHHAIFAK